MNRAEQTTLIGVFLNIILFVAKITIGLLSNSLSLLSDAFNSLTDIVSYTGIYIAVRISNKKADHDHPFGHHRAQPIAGFVVSLFTFLLAFEIMKNAIIGFFNPRTYSYEFYAIGVLIFTMIVKIFMSYYYGQVGKKENSPAVKAGSIDSRNDVLVSGIALTGVIGPWIGFPLLDIVAAFIIGLFIFYSGYKIGIENIDYLMGKSPPKNELDEIKKTALKIKGVKGVNEVKAHYVGNYVHIEIHIEVNKNMSTQDSHDIGKQVQYALEKLNYVDKAFIHIDPM